MSYSIISVGDEMNAIDELMNTFIVELKRGTLVISVLSQLFSPEYGYSLLQKLENKNVPVEGGTLYPLLRRLESQSILTSEWDTNGNRPRKFYVLSDDGKEIYRRLKREWRSLSQQVESLLLEEVEL